MEFHIKYKTPDNILTSTQFHALTQNGPYIDAHFGYLTKKTPVGQTYYTRPITEYIPPCINNKKQGCGCGGKDKGILKINIKSCMPFIHAQTNTVSNDLKVLGTINISPFEWNGKTAKIFPDQIIDVNIKIKNYTGLPMQGLHIHDGKGLYDLENSCDVFDILYRLDQALVVYKK